MRAEIILWDEAGAIIKPWYKHNILSYFVTTQETNTHRFNNVITAEVSQWLQSHFLYFLAPDLRTVTLDFLFVGEKYNFMHFYSQGEREAYVSENSWETSLSEGRLSVKDWKRKSKGLPGFTAWLSSSYPPFSICSSSLAVWKGLKPSVRVIYCGGCWSNMLILVVTLTRGGKGGC